MNINLSFERDTDGRWYAVIPSWTGDRSDLEMVMGADTMLDILSINYFDSSNKFSLNLESNPQRGKTHDCLLHLHRLDKPTDDFGGSFYQCVYGVAQTLEVWLCDVCLFVFNEFPETILIR